MRNFVIFFVVAAVTVLFCGQAQAISITKVFGDNTIHWAGYASNDYWDNNSDVIGEPHINGGTVTFSDTGILEEVTLDYSRAYWTNCWNWTYIPGDLFIDADADGDWDFIADSPGSQGPGLWQVYSAPASVEYVMTPEYDSGGWDVRNGHPYAVDNLEDGTLLGTVSFDGWGYPWSGSKSTSWGDFTSLGIDLGHQFILAYTVNCANDVIYEQIVMPEGVIPPQVPIPGAVWLLGSGLLGLLGLRKLKR